MSGRTASSDERLEAASDWVVRLQAGDLDDALAFDAWLEADPANREAYDAALAVWRAYDAAAPAVLGELRRREARRRPLRRGWVGGAALAAAAAIAAAVVILPGRAPQPAAEAYATAVGERRSLRLADGSQVELNAGTKLTVAFARDARRVTLSEGEAIFDVAHEPARPFLITAGDRTVRVVGTQFDVRRRDGRLSVTVARGLVEVRPTAGAGRAYRLHPGQQLRHRDGEEAVELGLAAPADVFGWREGRLVFHDQPLSEVIAEANLQLRRPIRLEDPSLAATRVSGVLQFDDEDAVAHRLALLAPVTPIESPDGVLLRRAGDR